MRQSEWRVAPIPADLEDRRTEITGPVDRKMVINALNSGAKVFMADFEDSTSPTWRNVIEGQVNLRDAMRREISFASPEGKQYKLNEKTATLFVRPRGWHLPEKHLLVQGQPISASLFDFGLYFFHNAAALKARGTGPYFYLPKMESHREARLWNSVFNFAQDALGIPRGTIRATVLIETLPAAFEMDEILFELKDHSAGLNCGRWDYIFSFIKKFSYRDDLALPDRSTITMDRHFLKSYVELLIETCHRRGIHAMGGMAAQIPIKRDAERQRRAMERVRQDKLREVKAGHDGTWVAHPGLVPVAKAVFDEYMPGPNQIARRNPGIHIEGLGLACRARGRDHAQRSGDEHRHRFALSGGVARWTGMRADLRSDGRRSHCGDFARATLAMGAPWRPHDRWRHARCARSAVNDSGGSGAHQAGTWRGAVCRQQVYRSRQTLRADDRGQAASRIFDLGCLRLDRLMPRIDNAGRVQDARPLQPHRE